MKPPQSITSRSRRWSAAAVIAVAMGCGSTAALAQVTCTQGVVGINPTTIGTICTITPNAKRELGVIARRDHLRSNAYGNVPAAQRPEQWPLGPTSIQSCRFCFSPDRQNLTRLEGLR